MSVARPAKCLFCSFSRQSLIRSTPRRQFHATPLYYASRKPKHENVKASNVEGWLKANASKTEKYTDEDKRLMKEEYTESQLKAVETGEKSISDEDMKNQFALRDDPWSFKYIDDFSTIEPAIDKHVRAPQTNTDPNSRLKTEDELVDDVANFVMNMPEEASGADWMRFLDNMRLTVGNEEAERNPRSHLVPDVFATGENFNNLGEHETQLETEIKETKPETPDSILKLMQITGYSASMIAGLKTKILVSHDVVNQTRLGKARKAYVLTVAGNGRGLLGIGEGKAEEHEAARAQALYRAIRNMQPIPMYENRTIYGDVKGKVSGTEILLMNRPPGFGLRCSQRIWEMCRVAGIRDIAVRISRNRNQMNSVKAAYQALMSQKIPEEVAQARGKKLVDVRKVYYAGNV